MQWQAVLEVGKKLNFFDYMINPKIEILFVKIGALARNLLVEKKKTTGVLEGAFPERAIRASSVLSSG